MVNLGKSMVNLWYFWIWWIFTGKILWLVNVAYSFLSDTLLIFALNHYCSDTATRCLCTVKTSDLSVVFSPVPSGVWL